MEVTGWCRRCGAEDRSGFTMCADCRVPLVDHPPPPDPADQADRAVHPDRRFVELARLPALEARMAVNRLRASGADSADVGPEPIYGSINFAEGGARLRGGGRAALTGQIMDEETTEDA